MRDRTWESVGDLLLGHYAAVLGGDDVAGLPAPRAGGSAAPFARATGTPWLARVHARAAQSAAVTDR